MTRFFELLAAQPLLTIFAVLALGYVLGRIRIGFVSFGSTAGSLVVALGLGVLAYGLTGVRFAIPDLVGTVFLALFTYAIGLRVGPQFVEGMRTHGLQLVTLVLVTTTCAFALAYGGSKALGLGPGFAAGILSGANTISAVMGVATTAIDQGLYVPPAGMTEEIVKTNIAAGYSLTYVFSVLSMVLLIRSLPGMFGIDPVAAGKASEQKYGAKNPLPGTSAAFTLGMLPVGVRVFRLTDERFVGRPVVEIFERFRTPVLRLTRNGAVVPLEKNTRLQAGDLLTIGGPIEALLRDAQVLGPEIVDEAARQLDIDQAEVVLTRRELVDTTLEELRASLPAYGIRVRALFRGGHEVPLLPGTSLARHDVLRIVGPPGGVARFVAWVGQAVRPTDLTDIITLGVGIAAGALVGLISVPVAGIPIGLGTMGGVVVAGMVVSVLRAINPALGGPMPEGARAFLESIGVDLFVVTIGLTVAPFLATTLAGSSSSVFVILLGIAVATVPTFVSWLVGLYVFKMEPLALAGAISGARNSTTAMRAISERSQSTAPSVGYAVPYALSTVVFLIYGYLIMLLP